MPSEGGIEPGFVDALLALKTREQQAGFLRDRGMLDEEGLDRLLHTADRLLNDDPVKARRLAELCADLADLADAPPAVPKANYIVAGAHSINGEFDNDLRYTSAAYDGYVALGMNLEALRTNVGKMVALLELGRYEAALYAGRFVLDALDGVGHLEVSPTPQERVLLAALVYQNQAICHEHVGHFDKALEVHTLAEEHYRSLGANERLGEIIDNRGVILRYLGRGSEALEAHEAAAAIFEETNLGLPYALALGNIGETHLQLGNYSRSLDAFERSRRLLNSLGARVDEHDILLDTANTYLALNLYPETLAACRQANKLLQSYGMRFERAKGLWVMGSALMAVSNLQEAREALDEAAALFAAVDNVPLLSSVMLEQASLLKARKEGPAALEKARRALELVSDGGWPVQQVYARLRLADLLLPDVTAAETHLLAARRLADNLALPQLSYRLNERLGYLRRLQGHDEEARTLLEAAIDEIEHLRGAVAQDAMRASFLRDKTAAYEDLLLLHLGRKDGARDAFAVAERAKSRALVDLISGVAEKEPVRSADPGLERRIRALQADLNAVYGELLGGSGDEERPLPFPNLHARAVELEQEISQLRLQSAAVGHDPDPFAAAVPPDEARDRLSPDAVLLAYHTVGDEILAFVNARGRVRVARRLSTVGQIERLLYKLDIQWQRFRAGRVLAERHMAMMERSAQQVLASLYEELVAPLEPLLEEVTPVSSPPEAVPALAIVPHGSLHRVPFHALFDGRRYLIERFEISYAPSATVYALCQDREPSGENGRVVFGVEDPLIPSAVAEARTVAEHLPGVKVRVGTDATVEALQEAVRSDLLHMACHGLFRSDNPMFSALKLHDGWLMAADAMSLDLPGALVTLSACESGRGEVIGGDEVLGLTRAFLGAGAATLVVSLWLVQDETTADLMGDWYGRLSDGEGRVAALRAAQIGIKERHPHPYYWAPFVLIGKR